MGIVYSRSKTLAASSATAICASQTPGAAGALTINGSAAANGVATLDTARQVLFTFAANETGHSFVLIGTNSYGVTQSETIAGTTAGTVGSVLMYLTVTSITISAAATGAIEVGTSSVGATAWFNIDTMRQPINVGIEVVVTGTLNYTVQYTNDQFWNYPVVPATAFDVSQLTSQTATAYGSLITPVTGIRLLINSGSGTGTITYTQAGP